MSFFLSGTKTNLKEIAKKYETYEKNLELFETDNHFLLIGLNGFEELNKLEDGIELEGVKHIVTESGFEVTPDRIGIKPIYYSSKHQMYASDVMTLVNAIGKVSDVGGYDKVYFSNCLKWGYDVSGRTPFNGIKRLAPGHSLLLIDENQICITEPETLFIPKSYTVEEAKIRLKEIMTSRTLEMAKEFPESALSLSGGLDSSIIYNIIRVNDSKMPKILHFENGEFEFIPEGIDMTTLDEMDLKEAISVMQSPIDLGSTVPMVASAKYLQSEGFKECFIGVGPDELFGGFSRIHSYDSQSSDFFMEVSYYFLPRQDRIERHYGINFLSPLINAEVIEIALGLPIEARTDKQIIKDIFEDIVPKAIIDRPKKPLKATAVIDGEYTYRQSLIDAFIENMRDLGLE